MSGQPFVKVVENQGVTRLALDDYLDLQTAPELEAAIQKQIQRKRYQLVIDCARLTFISSAGIGVFMGFIDEVRANNGDIVFVEICSEKVKTTFELVKFGELFDILPTYEEAVRYFHDVSEKKR